MAKHEKLTIENPALAKEWDHNKNGALRPEDFTACSGKSAWWMCKLGHSWRASIIGRNNGQNCPYCNNRRILAGFNDLCTINPKVANEWDYEKNGNLTPKQVSFGSNKSVWWRCKHGHSWKVSINNRNKGKKCPYCTNRKILVGFNDLCTTNPNVAAEWDHEKNGDWSPEQVSIGSNKSAWWRCKSGHGWKAVINSRKKCNCPYCYGKNIVVPAVNDLMTINPKLSKEWDYDKNFPFRPETVAGNARLKAWWLCEKGHNWQASPNTRNGGGAGCPYCSNQKVLKGYNDLLSVDPNLCLQWDYEKNDPLKPDEVTKDSVTKVWWNCDKGHSWKTSVEIRRRGCGCPYCTGTRVITGETDLKTVRPNIAAEWDYIKNGSLTPDKVTSQSMTKVWWLCEHDHSYASVICHRYYGTGCPYCHNKRPILGETDLATVHPEWLPEWDYEKNGSKQPEHYTSRSNKKVWWICKKEQHSWRARIADRHAGTNCPYCHGKTPIQSRLIK